MKLETLLNHVLPEGSVLLKHNHNCFSFYLDDEYFELGVEYMTQKPDETFKHFIFRVIDSLMEDEKRNTCVPLVIIDYALQNNTNK